MSNTAELELDGSIYFVEKDKEGNIVSREEIDGETVLNALVLILEESIRNLETNQENQPDSAQE